MDLLVEDKAYVVVGGSAGMGFETARQLAEEGARVAVIARGGERADAAVTALTDAGAADAFALNADVAGGPGAGPAVTAAAYGIRSPAVARLPYASLKSGVATFTKGIAKAYGHAGVRANCVCPGVIETGGLARMRRRIAEERGIPAEGALEKVMIEEWRMDVAMGRPGRPSEVGELVAFLLAPRRIPHRRAHQHRRRNGLLTMRGRAHLRPLA